MKRAERRTEGAVPARRGVSKPERPRGRTLRRPAPERATGDPEFRRTIHELRNRLSAMTNAVYFLKLVAPDDQRVQDYLEILDRELRALNRIVNPGLTRDERISG
jgi:signal transduction histidine kinase